MNRVRKGSILGRIIRSRKKNNWKEGGSSRTKGSEVEEQKEVRQKNKEKKRKDKRKDARKKRKILRTRKKRKILRTRVEGLKDEHQKRAGEKARTQ